MKKFILSGLILVQIISFQALAASLSIGTHASYFLPPESGASSTLMVGIDANYRIGGYFSAQLSIENANYVAGGKQYSLTPITLSLIAYPYPGAQLSPYVGGGIGYYDKKIDGVSDSTTGIHAMTGISVALQTFNAGFEMKYTIPDTKDMSVSYTSVSGNMTGGLYMEF